jgi:hypothetical protein
VSVGRINERGKASTRNRNPGNDLFRGGPNVEQNACVGDNGGRYDLFDYAHGYFTMAKKGLQAAKEIEVGVYVDTMVYPICYNFRHGIELFIKHWITRYRFALNDDALGFQANHSLQANWDVALAAMRRYCWNPAREGEVKLVTKTVREFMEIDPRGMIFRYPDSIQGEQHLKEWRLINLEIIEQRVNSVFEIFDSWEHRMRAHLYG